VEELRAGGPTSFKQTAMAPHAVETIQRSHASAEWELSLNFLEKAYGMHAAWERRLDRAALSSIQRLPGGPPSSHALLDSWLGRDTQMTFEDTLGRKRAQSLSSPHRCQLSHCRRAPLRGRPYCRADAYLHTAAATLPSPQSPSSGRASRRVCTSSWRRIEFATLTGAAARVMLQPPRGPLT
jgi:hypothetical protein